MNNDIIQLLEYLSNEKSVSLTGLETFFKCTRRQIQYRLNKINDFLVDQSFEPLIVRNNAIKIPQNTQNLMKNTISLYKEKNSLIDYIFEKNERIIYMFVVIFIRNQFDYLTIDYFIEELKVSRSTLFSDIKEMKLILKEKNIELSNNREFGYFFKGEESDIRNILMGLVINLLSEKRNSTVLSLLLKKNNLNTFEKSQKVIKTVSKEFEIEFVEQRLDEFIYMLIFIFARIENDSVYNISNEYFTKIKSFKEYQCASKIITLLYPKQKENEQELLYITSWILSVSFGNSKVATQDIEIITSFVEQMINRFNFISGKEFNFKASAFDQLYAHMRPAYYRLLFNLPVLNPLTNRIHSEYKTLFRIVDETMKPFKQLFNREIPESELAYLTMHFSNLYKENSDLHFDTLVNETSKTKSALIVCSNGIGSSVILYNELSQIFPEIHFHKPIGSYQLNEFNNKVDVIFTTDDIINDKFQVIPMIRVHPIISAEEKLRILNEVNLKLNGDHMFNVDDILSIIEENATINNRTQLKSNLILYLTKLVGKNNFEADNTSISLLELLSEKYIQLGIEAFDWEDAIKKSYQPLLQNEIITQNYVDETIKAVKTKGPYLVISKHIALAHSKAEDGALKNAMGLTVLNEPVNFGDTTKDPVKYIFTLSINGERDHISAMSELIELLNDPSFFEILNGNSTEKIIKYIDKKL